MSGLTIGSLFRGAARAVPERPAAALGEQQLTFGEIDTRADQLAHTLTARGLRRGDRVLCWTGTTLDVIPLFAALARMGAVYCPLPGTLGIEESLGIVEVADPAMLVMDAEHAVGLQINRPGLAVATLQELDAEARLRPRDPFPDAAEESDPHVLFFTSGSTGRPKGVILSHRVNYLRSHPGSQEEPRGAMVCVYPLFHMGAWTISLQQWQARDLVSYVPKPDGPAIVAAVERHQASRLNAMPVLWRRILDTLAGGQLPSLRFADSGTSATPPDLLAAIARACPHAFLRVFYGSTEAGNVASLTGDDVHTRPGSCGVPSQSTEIRIDDETGELCVRGPLLFDGYFGDSGASQAALRDGWYHTGDAAKVDEDGYLSIVGRLHDVIRTGGESVVPTEVEAALAGLPGAVEVAIVGLPDDAWGEIVCAVVVADPQASPPTLETVRALCAARLASYKHPRRLEVVETLPRTPATGQLQRRIIVQSLLEKEKP
jgi:fatty-acyl-CoA synthase